MEMGILLALLLVALFFGLGFAVHLLWIVAAVVLTLWVVGFALGRGASTGNRRFSRG
jgi:multisubunit Na+/H+ antiporter MnhG subunit